MERTSRLKSTGFTAACGGVTEAVLVVLKNQTKEAKMPRVKSSRVRKLISPNLLWYVHPVVHKLYPKGLGKSTVTCPLMAQIQCVFGSYPSPPA